MKLRILVAVLLAAAAAGCTAGTTTPGGTPTSSATDSQAWTPTGELAYGRLPTDRGDDFLVPALQVIDVDGTGGRRLPISAFGAVWSHDGARLLVSGMHVTSGKADQWRPALTDPDGRIIKRLRLPDLPAVVELCDWTHDEKTVVCDDRGLVRVDLATGKTTRITNGADQIWDISADGRIAFIHQVAEGDNDEDAELWTVDLDGSHRRKVTEYGEVQGDFDISRGSWLPDGSAIVAATPDGGLVEVDATSGELTEIPLDENLFAARPAVSPDGTAIAFEAAANSVDIYDARDIYVTPIGGGPVVLVVGTPDDDFRPDWRPTP